jgi:phycobilisome core-membrane linker protein
LRLGTAAPTFNNCAPLRSVELNFKHLLGRAPESYEEVKQHNQILAEEGYEAEIDSYIDSDEYVDAFGEDSVPFFRGNKTQTGKNSLSFTNLLALQQGAASSDLSSFFGTSSILMRSLIKNIPSRINPLSSLPPYQPLPVVTQIPTDVNKVISKVLGLPSYQPTFTRKKPLSTASGSKEALQRQYQSFEESTPLELLPDYGEEDLEIVIRAIYRQVLGNAHVMESERPITLESQLKNGDLNVREFVRRLAKSELYRSRFFDNCLRYRSIELNFKHLLGRAPYDYTETFYHSQILDQGGFSAEIDSYLDSDEYQDVFGENIVPYTRGYKTQTGQKLLGFTNMFKLLTSVSTSDKAGEKANSPRTLKPLIYNNPGGNAPITDVQVLLAEVLKPKPQFIAPLAVTRPQAYQDLQTKCQQQRKLIESLAQKLAELQPFVSIGTKVLGTWPTSETPARPIQPIYKDYEAVSPLDNTYEGLLKQSQENLKAIASLQWKIAELQRLALFGEIRLNKWRSRTFSS